MGTARTMMLGFACADALGVPYESKPRSVLKENPAVTMTGYGTYNLSPGIWSDDTSMCLAYMQSVIDSSGKIISFNVLKEFVNFKNQARYTATGMVFDICRTCKDAIRRFEDGTPPSFCGCGDENSTGNGALMRMPPLAAILDHHNYDDHTIAQMIADNSAMTHHHKRAICGCVVYCLIALELIKCRDIRTAVANGIQRAIRVIPDQTRYKEQIPYFNRIVAGIDTLDEDQIRSTQDIVDTLEAVLWCLLKTDSYKECVLKAVNLGGDTDTIAALSGALAAIAYGEKSIPKEWIDALKNKELLLECIKNFEFSMELS